jgi:hypothetical protein
MEEHRLTMFQNSVLRRIFGPKRDEIIGDRRQLSNKNFITCTPNIIRITRRMRWIGQVATMEEKCSFVKKT